MVIKSKKQAIPPYVPYSSFSRFINELKEKGVPTHIDRSIMGKMSGSGQSAMLSTLKSLSLINSESEPTDNLKNIVNASESDFGAVLAKIIKRTYNFLFDGTIDLENTTSQKVEGKFKEIGATGSTLTKCIAFFLAAAKAANISVSSFVRAPKLQKNSQTQRKSTGKHPKTKQGSQLPEDNVVEEERNLDDFIKITIPLHDMPDGMICLPNDMTQKQWQYATKIAMFMLENYRQDVEAN